VPPGAAGNAPSADFDDRRRSVVRRVRAAADVVASEVVAVAGGVAAYLRLRRSTTSAQDAGAVEPGVEAALHPVELVAGLDAARSGLVVVLISCRSTKPSPYILGPSAQATRLSRPYGSAASLRARALFLLTDPSL
jgi:hypothetical protein